MFRNPIVDALVILVVVLLFLGPKRLPELGKGLGRGMREFKEGITGDSKEEAEDRPALSSAPGPVTQPAPAPSANANEQPPTQSREAEVGSEPKA